MEQEKISKKLKRLALMVNLLQVVAMIVFEVMIYRLVSYKDYLVLDYIPIKYIIAVEVILLVMLIIPFFIKWGKKTTILSIIISAVMIVVLASVSIFCGIYDKQLKNIFSKADQTLDKVVENSKLSTDEYGVYVLKDDAAKEISDAKTYKFGYCSTYSAEDTSTVIDSIQSEVRALIDLEKINDPSKLAEKLINGQVKAVILNQSMIELIESAGDDSDDGKKNGQYFDFSDKIRCIYTVNIKNALADKKDKGNITDRCFNVYISGIDIEGDVTARSRSDVNIIMSVNPLTHQVVLVSTPRDYYIPLSISGGAKDKLTHAGNYGVDVSMDTLEMLYDIDIDYFIRMNFTGFVNIIDALGGIDVESDYSFSTHGYSYSAGLNQNLSGIEALWFARERHAFAEGDKQRGKDQMKVIEAVIEKCQSSALLKNYDEILNDVSESIQTNMTKKSIKELVKYQLDNNPNWKVITYSVSGTGGSNYTYSTPSARAYVMEPDQSTVDKAKDFFEKNKQNVKIKKSEYQTETE